jgi:hypothetical protein
LKKKAVGNSKKKAKKLRLSRETLRELARRDASQVKAAAVVQGMSTQSSDCGGAGCA